MSVVCALSNEIPQVPVISQKNGYVYEKRLIEKYLEAYKTDPISCEAATIDDYTEIKGINYIKPKAPSITSIPAILKAQHDEWDSCMLFTFEQKQQMQTLKQELSHSLYQHDASLRVVSRLFKEVTAAREALSTLKPHSGVAAIQSHVNIPSSVKMEMEIDAPEISYKLQEPIGMNQEIETQMITCSKALTSERKKKMKQLPEELVKSGEMEKFVLKETKTGIHSVGLPGILTLDVCKRDTNRILTGGNDKNAVVYDTKSSQILSVLSGHSKKVTSVIYHPTEDVALTASPDSTVRIWSIDKSSCEHVIKAHTSDVTGLSLHATNKYVLSCGNDGYWAFSDIETGKVIVRTVSKNKRTDNLNKFNCMKSHPDGLICANGTEDGEIIIWHLKENCEVASLSHSSPVTSLAFSENGFYLATGATDGIIKLWDLRKVKEFKSFSPSDDNSVYQIEDLEFDVTGTYLGVAGSDVRIFLSKQWNKVVNFTDHTGLATGIRFGHDSHQIFSSGLDRSVRIYGAP